MMHLMAVSPTVRAATLHRLELIYILLLIATLMEMGARIDTCATATRLQLLFDLLMRPCRVVTDQIVKNSHVAVNSLQELLLVLLHFVLNCGLSCLHLLLDELLNVFFDS